MHVTLLAERRRKERLKMVVGYEFGVSMGPNVGF